MKVSGFSFIRDGVRLGYPFEESIRSALPVCDEFIVAVGECQDGTLAKLQAMNEPKLRLIRTTWNERCRSHGFVYGQQKMIAQYNCTGDWAFYLEGDEILHEQDLERLRRAMAHFLDRRQVEVLAFDYLHFYGDSQHIDLSSKAYRKAARIIRNDIRSIAPDGLYWAVVRDKNIFGRRNKRRTRYPRAAALNIPIYHYGNARAERYLAAKAETANQYWEKDIWASAYGRIDPRRIGVFEGTHPEIIQPWLAAHANPRLEFDRDYKVTGRERKHRLLRRLENAFGWDFSKRHFKIIKTYAGSD